MTRITYTFVFYGTKWAESEYRKFKAPFQFILGTHAAAIERVQVGIEASWKTLGAIGRLELRSKGPDLNWEHARKRGRVDRAL